MTNAANRYPRIVHKLLDSIEARNAAAVEAVARATKKAVDGGGLIYVFGSGHSCLIALEAFHRAGGLIPVHPILHEFLTPMASPKVSGKLERVEGIAPVLFARSGARKGDAMWIASNSGVNAAAIEMAQACREAGVVTIALTNLAHSGAVASRHSSGKKLYELCDHVLDNQCPVGDALAPFGADSVGAGSTVAASFLYHWVLVTACELWSAEGKALPVYRSANTPGGDAHNESVEAPYRSRIPML